MSVALEQTLLTQGWWRVMRRRPIVWKQRIYVSEQVHGKVSST